MRAIGQPVAATVAERHARVEATLDVFDTMFDPGRDDALATFPLPRHRPTVLLGVNGPSLAALAGRRADGVNVGWDHPRRDELFAIALAERAERRGFMVTTWTPWAPELLDPDHPTRRAMADLDRVVLVVPGHVGTAELATPLRGLNPSGGGARLDPSPAWSSA